MQKGTAKPIKVGFDLDGVILYNPIRIFRPFAAKFKPYFFKKESNKFYFPKTSFEQFIWKQLHKTSFCVAPGIKELHNLIKEKKIEAYIITARYSFLKNEFDGWMKEIEADKYFSGAFYNKTNMQPNEFKKMMINKLKLDAFVEDNWGVVDKINHQNKIKIFWVSNIFDQFIPYKYKYRCLKDVLKALAA